MSTSVFIGQTVSLIRFARAALVVESAAIRTHHARLLAKIVGSENAFWIAVTFGLAGGFALNIRDLSDFHFMNELKLHQQGQLLDFLLSRNRKWNILDPCNPFGRENNPLPESKILLNSKKDEIIVKFFKILFT